MGRLGANNLNLNLNLNTNSNATQGLTTVRYNTQEFPKLLQGSDIFPSASAPNYKAEEQAANATRFRELWDAELRASVYVNEFLTTNPGWMPQLVRRLAPLHRTLHNEKGKQLRYVLGASDQREPRFVEIIDQHEADGAIKYLLGMLMLDAASAPATYALVRAGRRIGETVVMCLKDEFREARPSQVCSAIVPMVDPPITPSFPAGHALQGRLIVDLIALARPAVPKEMLHALSDRIADNRIIAGLHYRLDNEAGKVAAAGVLEMLTKKGTHPQFAALLKAAAEEEVTPKPRLAKNGSRP